MAMQLSSGAFESGGSIPAKYTCQGENLSPPLEWTGIPSGAKSLALIMDDPGATRGTFSHWVLYNIAPSSLGLNEGFTPEGENERSAVHGRNDFGEARYGGPCPPRGPAHRYYFRLYALDASLDLMPGATRAQVMDAIRDHILEETEWIGTYGAS